MSVKQWKQVITLSVIAIILVLLISVIISSIKYHHIKTEYNDLIIAQENANTVNLSDYGITDITQYENALRYLGSATSEKAISYQKKYKDMYVDNDFVCEVPEDKKVCYLTFDDGPSAGNTEKILDDLKKYDAKATFFVIYNDTEENRALLKRMVKEGHTIGVHTASHNYTKIYSSVNAYLKDFSKVYNWVYETTGVKPEIFRFPGGSVNSYNIGTYMEIISEMTRRGFTYYDWNCSSGDAAALYIDTDTIINNVVNKANVTQKIVLMHDGKGHGTTTQAVSTICKRLKEAGYSLEGLSKEVTPVHFDYYG